MPARQTTNTTQPEKSTKVEQQNQTTEKLNGTTKDSHHTTQKTEKLSSATQTKSGEENSDSTKKDSKQKSNSPSTETKTNTKPKVPVPPGSSVFPAHLFQNLTFIPGFLPFNFANLYPIKPTTSQNGQQQGKDSKDNADNKGGFNSTVINPLLIQLANNAAVKKQALNPDLKLPLTTPTQSETEKKPKESLSGPDIIDMLLNSTNTMKVIQPRPKPKPTAESIELAKKMLDVVAREQIKEELISYISSAADNELTERALKIHQSLMGTKEKSQQQVTDAYAGDETDLSSDESEYEYLDPVRKTILTEWNHIRSQYAWRWNWLELRMNHLHYELAETDAALEEVMKKTKELENKANEIRTKHEGPSAARIREYTGFQKQKILKRQVFDLKAFPPQKRRKDIDNHPLYSYYDISSTKTALSKISSSEILGSLQLYTTDYPPKQKGKRPQRRRPKHLHVNIPPERHRPVSKKGKTPSSTPSSTRKRSRPRDDWDPDEYVIPWNDIRNHFTIPDIKVKEIHTPKWKVNDEKDFNTISESSDEEDTSDEAFANRHIKYETEERNRWKQSLLNTARKKKRRGKQINSDNIFEVTVVHHDVSSPSPSGTSPMVSPSSSKTPGTPYSTPRTPREKLNPLLLRGEVTKESYIAAAVPCPKSIRGNYEEMAAKNAAWQKQRMEKQMQHRSREHRIRREYDVYDDALVQDIFSGEDEESSFRFTDNEMDKDFEYTGSEYSESDFEIESVKTSKDKKKKLNKKRQKGTRYTPRKKRKVLWEYVPPTQDQSPLKIILRKVCT